MKGTCGGSHLHKVQGQAVSKVLKDRVVSFPGGDSSWKGTQRKSSEMRLLVLP